jgi:hypothetical protein
MGDRDSQYDAWANFINNAYPKGTQQVTINQAVVNSNIRGLQSRTHKRGKLLAKYERSRTAAKTAIKNLRLVGYPVAADLLDFKDALGESVIALAKDQTLDRQLLKQQYVLQGQSRSPKPAKKRWAAGDVVRVLKGDGPYFRAGLTAKLRKYDIGIGDWEASFRDLGNPEGSFDDSLDGAWYIGNGREATFELI